MPPKHTIMAAACLLAVALPAQPAKTSLLFISRYDSVSLDAKAGVLSNLRPFDIALVTPSAAATASAWIPACAISASIGDPDNDGKVAIFAGLPHASNGIGGIVVKHADRKKADPRLIYWTVRQLTTTPPKIVVRALDKTNKPVQHTMRTGDFVRLKASGLAEFFITQNLIMKAAGPQSGNWVNGALALCQAANGDIFYCPAHGVSNNGSVAGGHWVNKPSKIFGFDGAIVRIPVSAITYDKNGNVADVKASSAVMAANEVPFVTGSQPTVSAMCQNSGALDSIGKATTVTFMMGGMDIDPNGGTWVGFHEPTVKYPNLIFTFANTATSCCAGPWGSWKGTVFSTAKNKSTRNGSIATINGRLMGVTKGKADGSWLGIKDGSGSSNSPLVRGLACIQAGFRDKAPYGTAVLQVANDGLINLKQDPNLRLGLQSPVAFLPSLLVVAFGVAKGAVNKTQNFNGVFGGYSTAYLGNGPFALFLNLKGSDPKGQTQLVFKLPTSPGLIGTNWILQAVAINLGRPLMTNPVALEAR